MIPQHLIEKALALTGRTMDDVNKYRPVIGAGYGDFLFHIRFSIEKFCYYLLSPEFIHEYYGKYGDDIKGIAYPEDYYPVFGTAIGEHQKGNEQPLISLLEKICR